MIFETSYLPPDRLRALADGVSLATTAAGTVLFADISGFTLITEKLRQQLGARRGAETLATILNRVYDALIAQVERFNGSVISFAGDAITCWFGDEDAPLFAIACGFGLLDAMQAMDDITLHNGEKTQLGLKVSMATGIASRFVVGNPDIQLIDTLAGAILARMAAAQEVAKSGEVLVDAATIAPIENRITVREWREFNNERFAMLKRPDNLIATPSILPTRPDIADETVRSWLLPPVYRHFQAGLGEYLTELRPATTLFIRFIGIDYDDDPEAEQKLDQFVRLAQSVITRYEGVVLQLTIGDKGSYLYGAFGAPIAHEDDSARAMNAALEIRAGSASLGYLESLQIGISQGMMRTGAYGGERRRTYGVLGDEVNLGARLMQQASSGEILVSESLMSAQLDDFTLEPLPPMLLKGKLKPVGAFRLLGQRDQTFEDRFYTTPLVAREDDLAQVLEALQPIFKEQHAGIIYIYGEPGIGKSRLAFEVQRQLQASAPVTWMIGQADDLNRAPFAAFAYFLRPYFGQRRDQDHATNLATFDSRYDMLLKLADENTHAELVLYRSYLAGLVGLTIPDSPYEQADEKLRIENGIAGLKAWVRAESRRQPLILHLEDAHWADTSSIHAAQNLTYNMETVPFALVLTSRYNDDRFPYTLPNLFSVPIHAINLNRLSDEGVRSVAIAILGGNLNDNLAQFVRERAEGNPFFCEQLILDLKERDLLVQVKDVWDIPLNAENEVPSGINAVLIARLDRLAAQVKAVVQTASVLGREFDVQVLSRMLREGELPYIKAAEGEAIWSALDTLRYLFRHALLRDAAYQMQVQERLKSLHRLAAETIEKLYPGDVTQDQQLMQHWRAADEPLKELHYLAPVARQLTNISAEYVRAIELAKRGLTFAGITDLQRANLLNLLAQIDRERGDLPASTQWAQQAQKLAEDNGDLQELMSSLRNLAQTEFFKDNYSSARIYYEQLLAHAQEVGNSEYISEGLSGLGLIENRQGNLAVAKDHLEQALAISMEQNNRSKTVNDLRALGKLAIDQREYDTARKLLHQSLDLSREMGSKQAIINLLADLGIAAASEFDYATAANYFRQSLTPAREIGSIRVAGLLNNVGKAASLQGDYETALNYLQQGIVMARQMGLKRDTFVALYAYAELAVITGDYDQAQVYYSDALAVSRDINVPSQISACLSFLGYLSIHKGLFAQAKSYLEEALSIARSVKDDTWTEKALRHLSQIAIAEGNYEQAHSYVAEEIEIMLRLPSPNIENVAIALNLRGWLAYHQGNYHAAEAFFRESLGRHTFYATFVGLAKIDVQLQRADASRQELRNAFAALRVTQEPVEKIGVLAAATELHLLDNRFEEAAEMIGLILHHPALSYLLRLEAEALQRQLESRTDPSMLKAGIQRGKLLSIEEAIRKST